MPKAIINTKKAREEELMRDLNTIHYDKYHDKYRKFWVIYILVMIELFLILLNLIILYN